MRLCIFTPNFLPAVGGAERMADTLARGLAQRGHETMVLAQSPGGRAEEVDATLPYPVRRYARPPAMHLWPELLSLAVRKAHKAWKFDLMLAFYSYPTGYAASRVNRKLGFKLVLSPRGGDLYPSYHGLKKPRVRKIIPAGYRRADRIVVPSRWMAQRIKEVCDDPSGASLPPIDLVHNGIDVVAHRGALAAARQSPPALVNELGLASGRFTLQLGRVAPVKQVELAVGAVGMLHDLYRERGLKHVIVGEGETLAGVKALIGALGLEQTVICAGTRKGAERAWLYGNAKIFITTSREEGLPNVVIEAIASGLPIVASDIDPHRELLEGKTWGRLFTSGDAASLAAVLRGALELPERDVAAMQAAALQDSVNYSLDAMLDGFERACRAAMGEAPADGL